MGSKLRFCAWLVIQYRPIRCGNRIDAAVSTEVSSNSDGQPGLASTTYMAHIFKSTITPTHCLLFISTGMWRISTCVNHCGRSVNCFLKDGENEKASFAEQALNSPKLVRRSEKNEASMKSNLDRGRPSLRLRMKATTQSIAYQNTYYR